MISDDKTPQQKWRESNPKAYWAHRATHSALNSGLIQWLCRGCHKALHAKVRGEAE